MTANKSKFIRRTLIIGLGGTGQQIIQDIRKRLLERYDEIPPLIDFLGIDTDNRAIDLDPFIYTFDNVQKVTKSYILDADDMCSLNVTNFAKELKTGSKVYENIDYEKAYPLLSLMKGLGASGFRVLGRMYLLANHSDLSNNYIFRKIETIKSVELASIASNNKYLTNDRGELTVYIIGSLAGGTGSGTFIDIANLVRSRVDTSMQDRILVSSLCLNILKESPTQKTNTSMPTVAYQNLIILLKMVNQGLRI